LHKYHLYEPADLIQVHESHHFLVISKARKPLQNVICPILYWISPIPKPFEFAYFVNFITSIPSDFGVAIFQPQVSVITQLSKWSIPQLVSDGSSRTPALLIHSIITPALHGCHQLLFPWILWHALFVRLFIYSLAWIGAVTLYGHRRTVSRRTYLG